MGRPGKKMTHKKAGEDDRKVAIGRSRKKTTLPNESDSQHDEDESECQKCKKSYEDDDEKQQATWIAGDGTTTNVLVSMLNLQKTITGAVLFARSKQHIKSRVRNSKNQCKPIQAFSGAIDSPKW